jgi:hypothetical protein
MRRHIDPFRFLATVLAGWANQHQQDALEYLRDEKPSPSGTTGESADSIYGPSAHPVGRESEGSRPQGTTRNRDFGNARNTAGVASKAGRSEL